MPAGFEILGEISQVETIAISSGIRGLARLRKTYGRGRWRKRKGIATIQLTDGSLWLAEIHWYESRTYFETYEMKSTLKTLVVCIDNDGYPASLERRRIYVAVRDPAAEKKGLLRVVDESGEDYLYPRAYFRAIALPQPVRKAVLAAA